MAFETQTKDVILQRMLFDSPPDIDTREGSITNDLLSPSANEFENAYISLNQILTWGFVGPEQPSQYLDMRCAEVGITRKAPVAATGNVTFTGTDGTIIPIGTEVTTADTTPIVFVTTDSGTITGGTVTIAAVAQVAGISGNVLANTIILTGGTVSGVTSVNNASAFTGGVDTESDAELMARYFDTVRNPATSGNANHYVQWAKEVSGVYDAKCYPIWNGNGTVKVVLLGEDGRAPAQSIVDAVDAYIEDGRRPVGASVTIVGATEVAINVTATLTLATGGTLSAATTEIQAGLSDYLKSLAFVDPVVRYTKIGEIILNATNVLDYSGLTVNGGTANVSIADGSVAVGGTVTLS